MNTDPVDPSATDEPREATGGPDTVDLQPNMAGYPPPTVVWMDEVPDSPRNPGASTLIAVIEEMNRVKKTRSKRW